MNIKFNKFISTIISVDLLYDHDQIQKLQLKQTLGVGISYNLGLQAEDRPDGKKFIKPFGTGVRDRPHQMFQNSRSRLLYCIASEI